MEDRFDIQPEPSAEDAVLRAWPDRQSLPLCPARYPPQAVAACLSIVARAHPFAMGTKSRESHLRRIGPGGGRPGNGSTQGSRPARLSRRGTSACSAFRGRRSRLRHSVTRSTPAIGYLEVKCLGCNTHQTVALDIVRRPKATPIHELERYMRCKDCSRLQGRPYKRSHLVALRPTKISPSDPPSTWWPGER